MDMSYSTSAVDEDSQLDYWQRLVCDTFLQLEFERPARPAAGFHGELAAAAGLDVMRVATVTSDPHAVSRSRELIRRSLEDDLLVNVVVRGRVAVEQDGRRADLLAGDFTLYDSARPCRIACPDPFRMVVLQIPRDAFAENGLPRPAAGATATAVRGDRGVGGLVSPFLRALADRGAALTPRTAHRIAINALGLLTTALSDDAGTRTRPPALTRASQLARARRYIADHLDDPLLTPADVAEGLGLSVRYLHSLFRAEGASPLRWIVAQRLEQSARLLADPFQGHLSITDIAFAVGFKDASHFSRSFRGCYGVSPRAYRTRHARPPPARAVP
ncbi:helix-turn-helix domain-containing protein [Streptomyces bathyalis]|uniref:Helix-turn-helix domain-containing protein n=1 Tax=Streptomyces bathyalis TaxID=2710756 RepID=A0A7T1WRJ7_9ACTN|nr:helix-turn-helix domain-containing protein [Streptomyces bathyalis]QPP08138.1 helix-turn-helix domain-containing protein [Streptomyces bathyalis]